MLTLQLLLLPFSERFLIVTRCRHGEQFVINMKVGRTPQFRK